MSAKNIDLAVFRDLQETAGAEFVGELIGTFLEEAPVMLGALREAMAANDPDKFRRAAHSLKSNSNTFGALGLGAMARELELGGMAMAKPQALDQLAQTWSLVAAELAALRDA